MKDNIDKELDDLSPFLSKHKKSRQNGQSALPEDYFVNFENRLMDRVKYDTEEAQYVSQEASGPQRWKSSMKVILRPKYLSLAAACLFGIVIGWQYIGNSNDLPVGTTKLLAELSVEETQNYLVDNVEDIELDEIATIIADTELQKISEDNLLVVDDSETMENSSEATKEEMEDEAIQEVPVEKVSQEESSIQKAIDKTNTEGLLDDITEEEIWIVTIYFK